jgi:adenine deaminase
MISKIMASKGNSKSQLVIKNIGIINVFTQEIEVADIAIHNGEIVGIGVYDGEIEVDGSNKYAAPGFIDAHVHVESSMMTPPFFSRALLKRGITAVIADPHEIANVHGIQGVEFMIKELESSVIDIHYMAPSCVPAVAFESGGAVLSAEDLITLKKYKSITGLAEVMDVEAVLSCEEDMLKKLDAFKETIIDGHAPLLSQKALNAYITAGVKTDHECSNAEEALEKVRRGMYVLIREGSAAKNLKELLPAVTDFNYHRFLFCTDDRHADDLFEEGSIDNVVRKAIKLGMDPIKAITIASYNVAKCYDLKSVGALSPGYKADILIFRDLDNLELQSIVKDGNIVDSKGYQVKPQMDTKQNSVEMNKNSMNINPINSEMLKVKAEGQTINVIEAESGSLITNTLKCSFEEHEGVVEKVDCKDVLKITVLERHKATGNYYVGYIKGLGIKGCSIAQTISHDSHNIIAIGEKDEDIAIAVNALIASGGGIAIAAEGEIRGILKLPIGGLMKEKPIEVVAQEFKELREILKEFSIKKDNDVFLTLSFMSLPVIPHIKITSKGLFDFDSFSFKSLFDNTTL